MKICFITYSMQNDLGGYKFFLCFGDLISLPFKDLISCNSCKSYSGGITAWKKNCIKCRFKGDDIVCIEIVIIPKTVGYIKLGVGDACVKVFVVVKCAGNC